MDEADYLGDRIAIMSHGLLRCYGSPLYLKSKFDSGYSLLVNKKSNSKSDSVNQLTNLIQRHVLNATLKSSINNEISYNLPKEQASKFSGLFNELEVLKNELNIINIGISIATVEEIFLKICDLDDEADEQTKNKSNKNFEGLFIGLKADERNDSFVAKYSQQLWALLVKKFIYSLRNKVFVITQLILPVIFPFLIIFFVKFGPGLFKLEIIDAPALNISIDSYQDNIVPFNLESESSFLLELSSVYKSQFKKTSNLNKSNELPYCSESNRTMDDYLICVGNLRDNGLVKLTYNYIIGATFESSNKIIAHFNNEPYHASPLALNSITNAILKLVTNSSNAQINVINHPLPRNPYIDDDRDDTNYIIDLIIGILIACVVTFGYSFLISSFITFLIRERVTKAKHMQYLSGVHPACFWLSNLIWDWISFMIPSVIIIILFIAFDIKEYSGDRLQYVIGLFMLYGLSHIPQTYLFSYIFVKPSSGFAANIVWNIFTSQITLVVSFLLIMIFSFDSSLDSDSIGNVILTYFDWISLILFPNYCFGVGLIKIQTINLMKKDNKPTVDYLSWENPGIGRNLVFLFLEFIFYFGLVLVYEIGLLRRLFYFSSSSLQNKQIPVEVLRNEENSGDIPKDEDVMIEEERIANDKTDFFCIDHLTKHYSSFMAVKGISFGIKEGECFGLLGLIYLYI